MDVLELWNVVFITNLVNILKNVEIYNKLFSNEMFYGNKTVQCS